jgi:hypothetical protein
VGRPRSDDGKQHFGGKPFPLSGVEKAILRLDLRPKEVLRVSVNPAPNSQTKGYVLRVIQFSDENGVKRIIGGQTLVAGPVEGFTHKRQRGSDLSETTGGYR